MESDNTCANRKSVWKASNLRMTEVKPAANRKSVWKASNLRMTEVKPAANRESIGRLAICV